MGSTSFEGMSHKQMIAWLDQANSAAVQGVADRLSSAAKEISKIGEELKIRPQIVKWKGDGADSFRTWSADLANATLRLGEFSKDASNRLGETATAIAQAKAAIPRPTGDPEASLKAAESARNDPDSAGLIKKLNGEREAAAAEMRKLSQTYSHSVAQLDNLKRPEFPPPPQVIMPKESGGVDSSRDRLGPTASGVGASAVSPEIQSHVPRPTENTPRSIASAETLSPTGSPPPDTSPVRMGIDSVVTRPEAPTVPNVAPALGQAGGGRPDVVLPCCRWSSAHPQQGCCSAAIDERLRPAGKCRAAFSGHARPQCSWWRASRTALAGQRYRRRPTCAADHRAAGRWPTARTGGWRRRGSRWSCTDDARAGWCSWGRAERHCRRATARRRSRGNGGRPPTAVGPARCTAVYTRRDGARARRGVRR